MSRSEVMLAVGRVLKSAAADEAPDDEYRRSQLLSAYSVARHVAAEEEEAAALETWFRAQLAALGCETAPPPAEIGAELGDLLAELRGADDQRSAELQAKLRRLLRELCDREVAALAAAV